jgi:hypothetical protein
MSDNNMATVNYETGSIPVEKLNLDIDNPRLLHEVLTGNPPQSQLELETSISGDPQFRSLMGSIKKNGVQDPIWVSQMDDGTYLVREGNRRTTCLKMLLRENAQSPPGVDYSRIKANIIHESASDLDIKVLCARLQTGKAVWGPFNVSALIHDLHNNHNMAIEDIATELQSSIAKIKKSLKSYQMFLEYSRDTGDAGTKRFAYFNECPKKVIEWIDDSPRNKKDYHKWIDPSNGQAKIRSAATKGGLRDFAKVIDDSEALQLMREDPMSTVEDAMDVVKQNDIKKDMPFLARLLPFQASLNNLSDEQKARIASEPRIRIHIKSLKAACDNLLSELDAYDQ